LNLDDENFSKASSRLNVLEKVSVELTFEKYFQVVFGASHGNPNRDKVWSAKVQILKSQLATQFGVSSYCRADFRKNLSVGIG